VKGKIGRLGTGGGHMFLICFCAANDVLPDEETLGVRMAIRRKEIRENATQGPPKSKGRFAPGLASLLLSRKGLVSWPKPGQIRGAL